MQKQYNGGGQYAYRPPAVFLYFTRTTTEQLILELDEIAERFQLSPFGQIEWLFPGETNCLLMIGVEQSMPREYDEVTRESLAEEVGSVPSAILRVVLDLRHPNPAADAATAVTLHLLDKYFGVVEDGSDDHLIWTANEIRRGRRGSRFLAHYRIDRTTSSNLGT